MRIATLAAAAGTMVLSIGQANASAWNQRKGEGQVILSGIYSHSDKGFDPQGRTFDIADYDKQEVYLLGEYGVTDNVTVIVIPSLRHVGIKGSSNDTSGLGYTELGARYRLVSSTNWAVAIQATARIPGSSRRDVLAQVGSTDAEYDVRGLLGRNFSVGRMTGYVDVQGGYRFRSGEPPNEFRADATVGIRPIEPLLIYAQVFNVLSDGDGRGVFRRFRYHNGYLNAAYDVDRHWTVQFGGLATLGGRRALRERGLTAGLWYRF